MSQLDDFAQSGFALCQDDPVVLEAAVVDVFNFFHGLVQGHQGNTT